MKPFVHLAFALIPAAVPTVADLLPGADAPRIPVIGMVATSGEVPTS